MLAPNLLADLKQRINAAGLSSHADAILAVARSAVDLILDGASDGAPGETRFGGAPDLPIGAAWPRNARGELLAFLAQINLSEIPPFDGNPFPAGGWLSVFIGSDESLGDIEHRLILTEADAQLAPCAAPDEAHWAEEDFCDMTPHHVKLHLRADVPHYGTRAFNELAAQIEPDEDKIDEISDALMTLTSNAISDKIAPYIGQLLGWFYGLNGDSGDVAYVAREIGAQHCNEFLESLDKASARDWVSLLHLESIFAPDLNFCIWDAGFLSFMILRDDLAKLDFGRVYVGGQSS